MSRVRCIISAGPTREYFDPVRFISNPSSGKMGYALAEAAAGAGWHVELVSGPVCLPRPANVEVCRVVTGDEMLRAIDCRFDHCDILIMCAAVTDFRPKVREERKVKKESGEGMTVEFERTVDILKTVAARKKHQLVVGFAAETNDVEQYAKAKMKEKNCDYIVANCVGGADGGFESDNNTITLLGVGVKREEIGPLLKRQIASRLITRFAQVLEKRVKGA